MRCSRLISTGPIATIAAVREAQVADQRHARAFVRPFCRALRIAFIVFISGADRYSVGAALVLANGG
jgi:hypothetical protein